MQDYLKVCYRLSQESPDPVTTSKLASALSVAPPSVTNMVTRLVDQGLARRNRSGHITLSKRGLSVALEIIRHHRLLETFLVEQLGMDWASAHEEAEVLEHYISERLEHLIDKHMGHPKRDPHGEPIPCLSGRVQEGSQGSLPLLELCEGAKAIIQQVAAQDTEILRYLEQEGLTPGTKIQLIQILPFDGPLCLAIKERRIHLGQTVAACISVDPLEKS